MKTIHISNKIVSVLFKLEKVFILGYLLLGFLLAMCWLFYDLNIGFVIAWLVGFVLIYVCDLLTGKPTVYLTTSMINAFHHIDNSCWLKVAYVKKTAKNEVVYDVVYFDKDTQVHTETINEKDFLNKIGENSTHYKSVKEIVILSFKDFSVNAPVTLFKSPFLEVKIEVLLDIYDLPASDRMTTSHRLNEYEKLYEFCRYDQQRMCDEQIEILKESFLKDIVHELNRVQTKYRFELLNPISPDTHKTDVLGESSFRE